MTTLRTSDQGQITLPAVLHRKMRLEPRSLVPLEVREEAVVLRPVGSSGELEGVFRARAQRRGDLVGD